MLRKPGRTWFDGRITQSVFLADTVNGVVDIFDFSSRRESGQIAGFASPEGLATDARANLYVADTLTQAIKVYAKPYIGNATVLHDDGFYPVGVHVDKRGNIYVANICAGSGGSCMGNGGIVVYAPGSQTPATLTGGPGRAFFVTTDAHDNVWVDGQVSVKNSTSEIGYFDARNKNFITVPIALGFPGGLTFDRSGNLLLDDQEGAPNGGSILNVYPPGATAPASSIALQANGDDIVDIALGTAQARIFAPDFFSGTASIITYPGGVEVNTLEPNVLGGLEAVAIVPGSAFRLGLKDKQPTHP